MKILISAYACEPGKGSEPGVGWNVAKAIAKHHEVWIFTSHTHQTGIEAELSCNPDTNLRVVYLDPLGWVYDWSKEGKRAYWDVHFHYYLWQVWAYFVAQKWHQTVKFDIVHHVTYVKYSGPSFLSLLPIPFIWGPVGGGESAPKAFWQDFDRRGKLYEIARNINRWIGEHDPFVKLTMKRSRLILATTVDTAQRLQAMGAEHVHRFPESGLSQADIDQLATFSVPELESPQTSPARFISMARLIHWKGLHLGLRAFAQANLDDAEYWILGDGPERRRLQRLAEDLDIAHQVKFVNKLPRSEALQKLGESSALLHPSLHDSGGWVCLEAMAAGCPVICLNLGGPAEQVPDTAGFRVSVDSPEQTISEIATAMRRLAIDPKLKSIMGQAGQMRVQNAFTWEAKGNFFSNLYQEIYTKKASVPSEIHQISQVH